MIMNITKNIIIGIFIFVCSSCVSNKIVSRDDKVVNKNITTQTLFYHSGLFKNPVSPWGDGTHTPRVAVKFTPNNYPVILTQVQFFVMNISGSETLFDIHVYRDKNGQPESSLSLISVLSQSVPETTSSGEWITVNIPNIEVKSGSIWVSMEWKTKPLISEKGRNSHYLGTDESLDYPERNYFHFNKWIGFIESPAGDAMVKAIFKLN